jgi:hypothetical protein
MNSADYDGRLKTNESLRMDASNPLSRSRGIASI